MQEQEAKNYQNIHLSSCLPPENQNKLNKPKNSFPIKTHLEEIYGKNNKQYIEEKIEPIYEEMKNKFISIFDKKSPTFFIRIPYIKILLGDNITNLFEDKILTTLDKDIIICGIETENYQIGIELFDEYYPSVSLDLSKMASEEDITNYFQEDQKINIDFIKYIFYGFKYSNDLIKPRKNKGINILICFNSSKNKNNKSETLKLVNLFAGLYISSFYIYDYLDKISKRNLFDFLYDDLNKIMDCENLNPYLNAMFFLEDNSIGIYHDNSLIQYKTSSNTCLLFCDSLTPNPPIFYSKINYWNKRKVEYRLAITILLKKLNSDITKDKLLLICSNFKEMIKFFDNNLEIIFKSIENHIKKEPYKLKEIHNEINEDLGWLLADIDFCENILSSSKDFRLFERIIFIVKEYERIVHIFNMINNIKDKTNENFNAVIFPLINESSQSLNKLYDCYSEEIHQIISHVESFSKEMYIRLASDGWGGDIVVLGDVEKVSNIHKLLINYYNFIQSKDENLVKMWFSDEMTNYCDWSHLGGSISILKPDYEDFMY